MRMLGGPLFFPLKYYIKFVSKSIPISRGEQNNPSTREPAETKPTRHYELG